MGTNWTKEQLEAIETRGCNLLVAAAAGSGKTAVLVERIIRIITNEANPVDVDRLLVVTFTKAAASEMRERIASAITKALEQNPSSKNLQKQLTLLNRANITNMHSFCLDVIKNHYHTIDLDPGFRIADSTEVVLIAAELMDELFEELYEEDNDMFLSLVEAYSNNKNDDRLKEIVKEIVRFVMSGPNPEKWLKESADNFRLENGFDGSLWFDVVAREIRMEFKGYLRQYDIALKLAREDSGLIKLLPIMESERKMFKQVINALDENDFEKIGKSLREVVFVTQPRIDGKSVENEVNAKIVKGIRTGVKKFAEKILNNPTFYNIAGAFDIIKCSYPYMKELADITIKFIEKFNARKRELNILDFGDMEHLCLDILTNEDGSPSPVALNFKEFFDEVLVDEYQDSNNVQEAIIDLVSRKYSDRPNVFMVGDVKQSIYRFRQAKPELFLNKYNTYSKEEGNDTRVIQLYKNFRSRMEIVDGVNYIFEQVMSETVGELEYTEEEALNLGASFSEAPSEVEVGGPLEFHIVDTSDCLEEDDSDAEVDKDELSMLQLQAKVVARRIKELMSEKSDFKIVDKKTGEYRKPTYKDIVILLRSTSKSAPIFTNELTNDSIPVYADASSGYFESTEIMTITALLKIIDNPLQDIPLIAIARSPIFNFTAEDFADVRKIDKTAYFYENIIKIYSKDAIQEIDSRPILKEKCIRFVEKVEEWRNRAVFMPIDELLWFLYTDTSYYGYVGAMPNGILRQANLKMLFQKAKAYEKTSFKGLFNFINFIDKIKKSSGDMDSAKIMGEHEDVVRIMSIHKSKGLEFPIVFIANAEKQFNLRDGDKAIVYHDELGMGPKYVDLNKRLTYSTLPREAIKKKYLFETLSEEMRILYVAFTRAKEKLIIVGGTKDFEKLANKWCRAAALEDDKVSVSEVSKMRTYMDWIGTSLCNHIDGEEIRSYADENSRIGLSDTSSWKFKLWNKVDINSKDEVAMDADEFDINDELKGVCIRKEITDKLTFEYKYNPLTVMKSNFSVTDLKKASYEEIEPEYIGDELFKEKVYTKPRFIQEKEGLSSAEKGTAVHYVMQKIDYSKITRVEQIQAQLDDMLENELLTKEEHALINAWKIKKFFMSDIGRRAISAFKSGNLFRREFPFFLEIDIEQVDKEIKGDLAKEKVRLQGIIDLCFEENGKIVLVDYKTDFIGADEDTRVKMEERYKLQMDYYQKALEQITGMKVEARILFLFFKEQELAI